MIYFTYVHYNLYAHKSIGEKPHIHLYVACVGVFTGALSVFGMHEQRESL